MENQGQRGLNQKAEEWGTIRAYIKREEIKLLQTLPYNKVCFFRPYIVYFSHHRTIVDKIMLETI
jgi:hypothetical protein